MRRRSLLGGVALAATTGLAVQQASRYHIPRRRPQRSRVAILRCDRYETVQPVIEDGLRLLAPDIRGKRVLLKPNLVEHARGAAITHPMLIAAVIEALRQRGAASVIVAEGPGHIRDTELLLEESGLQSQLDAVGKPAFVDLNFDPVARVPLTTGITNLKELWLPETLLSADFVVSMPKIKTHHWAGVTLSLKNLFGVVPGSVYGWPKNILHWQGIGNSIVELAAAVPIHLVIADGIDAMEGNGPLHGPTRHLGCIVFANDPLAADGTCCQLMGINPTSVSYLRAAAPLGNLDLANIDQRGERIDSLRQNFDLMPGFLHLRD